ncbi:MAG TPA: hypothetical protein DIW66_11585 [Serratia liquefaciens]|nr:hypothetical protein [Serratia liquefaciens]
MHTQVIYPCCTFVFHHALIREHHVGSVCYCFHYIDITAFVRPLASSFGEPEDHLALVVELLSHLNFALTEAGNERRELLELRSEALIHCLSWLPEFNQRCLSYDKFGFYAALSGLLLALMRLDAGMPMQ